jgi:hypothetical protein
MADIDMICVYCDYCCSVTVYDRITAVFTKEVDSMIDYQMLIIGTVVNENPVAIGRFVECILNVEICLS